MELSANHRHGT